LLLLLLLLLLAQVVSHAHEDLAQHVLARTISAIAPVAV
jgi:hypothetical protein